MAKKTYKTIMEKPRLVIKYDNYDPESPRAWDNIGLLFTKQGRYESPDGTAHPLYDIMMETEEEAENTDHHIKLMKERAAAAFKASTAHKLTILSLYDAQAKCKCGWSYTFTGELTREEIEKEYRKHTTADGNSHDEDLHVIDIFPVYCYEHGGIAYRRGTAHGFDYSNCGFYFVTAQRIAGEMLTPEKIKAIIDAELEIYTQWANGDVYRFELYDEAGELVDSCSGFYDLDNIKDHLPEEWQDDDMEDYLQC